MQHKNYFDHFVKIIRHSGLSEIKISNMILISLYQKLYRFYLQRVQNPKACEGPLKWAVRLIFPILQNAGNQKILSKRDPCLFRSPMVEEVIKLGSTFWTFWLYWYKKYCLLAFLEHLKLKCLNVCMFVWQNNIFELIKDWFINMVWILYRLQKKSSKIIWTI